MCGICGKLNFEPNASVDIALIRAMLGTIRHRGPDDEGLYTGSQVALGHRRLSIIDVNSGHQPLSNENGTVWIAFNGEIYNFRELRTFLVAKGHVFKTETDTEAIIHLYEEFGPECLEKLRGMFAFAIWDENQKMLFLARDRVGIKPLYYSSTTDFLVFASEIKAILADPEVDRRIAPEIIDRFLTFSYLPGEETLLKGIKKLPPGHYLLVKDGRQRLAQYWDLQFSKLSKYRNFGQAKDELVALLSDSVEGHMIADVPVGVLLSGGIDSTAVLSFAVEKTTEEVSSYTVGFSDPAIPDERPYARIAANAYGSRHHEMTISADDFAAFLPRYVWHMEEPVCEPPAVALYYVSNLASAHVKVLLSGEGGDEAFAGYGNYRNIVWLERLKAVLPSLNGVAGSGLALASSWFNLSRVARYAPLIKLRFSDYYYSRTSNPYRHSGNGHGWLYLQEFGSSLNTEYTIEPVRKLFANVRNQDILDQMLYIDTKTWLPDDLLIKADKITMANSVELRVPLLDHRLLEFAASLPSGHKLRGFALKRILKQAVSSRVPKKILKRKKAGFPVPYKRWLRSNFRDTTRALLMDKRTLERGYFRRAALEQLVNGKSDGIAHSKELFSVITLELWHRLFLDGDSIESASFAPKSSQSGMSIPI